MDEIISAVSNVGFPIVCCLIMFWYLSSKIDKLTDCINNNTKVIEKLLTKHGGEDDDENEAGN